ncbi:glucosylglycerate hydrolase [Actinoallomurus soli]|uniref:glucosylglycerate hydrolase n=1 Tax=Actinoallomurus soli TaxID=2952535 RepID=UPI002092B88D|nr:glycogen debranching protein [Actinoallomurus soli]MCO5974040.1 glycogen debranching protein [Actinoallomurus soli]
MADSDRPSPDRHRLWVVRRLSRAEVAEQAAAVLRANDRGSLTVAAPRLYPHMWSWDAAFIAVGLARISPSRALTELETLFAAQWGNGMVPHIVFSANAPLYEPGPDRWAAQETSPHAPGHAATSGLIQPPVHASALLRILDAVRGAGATERRDVLTRVRALWPRLLAWHRYLAEQRDADGRGLLMIYHGWESGMDNSPRWDVPYADVVPDPDFRPFRRSDLEALGEQSQRPTDADYVKYQWLIEELRQARYDDELARKSLSFRVADVFASAIFAAANEDLARVGDELGLGAGDELLGYAARFRRGVLGTTDEDGFAADVDLRTDTTLRTRTIAGFAPLLSGGLDTDRRRRLVDLLHSPAWCGNPDLAYPLPPSTSPAAPEFDVARYWRGPQWPPMNLLLVWGLERSGEHDAADRLREAALHQLTDGVFAEYYQPFTAHPLGSRPQSWTAAVALDLAGR